MVKNKENKKTVTLDELKHNPDDFLKELEVQEPVVEEDNAPTPFAAMLREHSDDFEGCETVEEMCDLFKALCIENKLWDHRRKEQCIRLYNTKKYEYGFTMIWNWILGGQANKTYTAR